MRELAFMSGGGLGDGARPCARLVRAAMLVLMFALAWFSPEASGQDGDITSLGGPLLYPANRTYYQLFEDFRPSTQGPMWKEARASATMMTGPEGRRGRLAVIDDSELYAWILQNFDLKRLSYYGDGPVWIGLRYWCAFRKLTDSAGRDYHPRAFAAWDEPWYRDDGIRCDTMGATAVPYMGVYISGAGTQRWRATGLGKRMPFYLVEYPPPEETAAAEVPDTGEPPR